MGIETISRLSLCALAFVFLNGSVGLPTHPATAEPDAEELLTKQRIGFRIKPEKRGGEAFKLIYLVPVSVDVFRRFKTDFRGTFLLSNRQLKNTGLSLNGAISSLPRTATRTRPTRLSDGARSFFLINTDWFFNWKTPRNAGIGFTAVRNEWNHSGQTPKSRIPLTAIFSVLFSGLISASEAG